MKVLIRIVPALLVWGAVVASVSGDDQARSRVPASAQATPATPAGASRPAPQPQAAQQQPQPQQAPANSAWPEPPGSGTFTR